MSFRSLSLAVSVLVLACETTPAPAVDAAAVPDAAVVDTGPMLCGTVPSGRITPMAASCMPRCSHASWVAYQQCRTQDCIAALLNADISYPVVSFSDGDHVFTLGCGNAGEWSCVQWQTFAIGAELCPSSYDAWQSCLSTTPGGGCQTELSAMLTCAQADPMFRTRFLTLAQMCFAAE